MSDASATIEDHRVGFGGALHDRAYRLDGRCWLHRRRIAAAALGLASGRLGLGICMSPDFIQPRIIVTMWARLFLIAVAASTVLLLIV